MIDPATNPTTPAANKKGNVRIKIQSQSSYPLVSVTKKKSKTLQIGKRNCFERESNISFRANKIGITEIAIGTIHINETVYISNPYGSITELGAGFITNLKTKPYSAPNNIPIY